MDSLAARTEPRGGQRESSNLRLIRAAFDVSVRSVASAGTEMRLRPATFHEDGDTVTVNGTMRVARAGGGFSESQISWSYRFHEGRLVEVCWSPRRVT